MKFDETVSILHVEDDEVDAESLVRSFKKNGIKNKLFHAENGLEALDLLRGDTVPLPRIVLLDINMPKMGGLEFLEEIRKDPQLKHMMVFMLTTSNQEVDLVRAHDRHVAGYIVKPASTAKLNEAVRTLSELWTLAELPNSKPAA